MNQQVSSETSVIIFYVSHRILCYMAKCAFSTDEKNSCINSRQRAIGFCCSCIKQRETFGSRRGGVNFLPIVT